MARGLLYPRGSGGKQEMKKHKGKFEDCELCTKLALAEADRGGYSPSTIQRKHTAALRRSERDAALRGLGLVRVRGALGGVYWE